MFLVLHGVLWRHCVGAVWCSQSSSSGPVASALKSCSNGLAAVRFGARLAYPTSVVVMFWCSSVLMALVSSGGLVVVFVASLGDCMMALLYFYQVFPRGVPAALLYFLLLHKVVTPMLLHLFLVLPRAVQPALVK